MPDIKLLMKGEILSRSFMGVNENFGVNRPLGGTLQTLKCGPLSGSPINWNVLVISIWGSVIRI